MYIALVAIFDTEVAGILGMDNPPHTPQTCDGPPISQNG